MGFASDVLGFEKFNLKDMFGKIKKDPKRLLLGVDQGSTQVWNKVLGKDDEPITNWGGGPTGAAYVRAGQQGVPTKAGHKMHDLAEIIAGMIVLNGAANVMGGGSMGGAPAGGATPSGATPSGGSPGLSSADRAALYSDAGYGPGMSGAETSAYDGAAAGGSKIPFGKFGNIMKGMQQEKQQLPEEESDVDLRQPDLSGYAVSSKAKKTAPDGSMAEAIARGAAGADPIDQAGVQMAAVQALTQRIEHARGKLAKLKGAQ
jgi:hypothetical protein